MDRDTIIYDRSAGWQKVDDFASGRLKIGDKLGYEHHPVDANFDDHIVFKRSQFNVIAGFPNVGKTKVMMWYFCCLAFKHQLKTDIYSSENELWSLKRTLAEFYLGKRIQETNELERDRARNWVDTYFTFIRKDKMYTASELLDVFRVTPGDICLIDPYNSLIKPKGVNNHDYDYEVCGMIRLFCNDTNKTLYINAHCHTNAMRMVHSDGDFKGYSMPPRSSDIEGGGKWVNRADDFWIIHRYTNHESLWMHTHIHVNKVKEQETGGEVTRKDKPVIISLRDSVKFEHNGQNILGMPYKPKELSVNKDFDNEPF